MTNRVFKVLDGLKSCHGGNHTWKIGEWVEVQGELKPCENGIHLCRESDLLHWLHNDIYIAEYDGEMVEADNKIVVRKARITAHCANWNEKTTRLFACWCVRQVVHLNKDPRVMAAIETAERYANGQATSEELAAAMDVAWVAAMDVAWAAASDTARDVASAAAWAAASDTAMDVAWVAAMDIAWVAAMDVAWVAARDTT